MQTVTGIDVPAYATGLADLISANREALNLHKPVRHITVNTLGSGESNLNLLLTINRRRAYTVRIARRPETEPNLAREFSLLSLLPANVGPHPFILDTTKKHIPHHFSILSFIRGEPVAHWTLPHFEAHAAGLARLHTKQISGWGDLSNLQYRPFRIQERFHDALMSWRAKHSWLFKLKPVISLIPRLDQYFLRHEYLFADLTSFSLVHGDSCVPNILFHNGEVRYIDWEWVSFSDPALDVCQMGWDIPNPPWNLAPSQSEIEAYLRAYSVHRFDATLRERRLVWMTFVKFTDHLHYRTRAEAPLLDIYDLPREHYSASAERIFLSLAEQFL
ncbi:MAG: hypothetical protein NVSMB52_17440 [Chloroflexota bacterium]